MLKRILAVAALILAPQLVLAAPTVRLVNISTTTLTRQTGTAVVAGVDASTITVSSFTATSINVNTETIGTLTVNTAATVSSMTVSGQFRPTSGIVGTTTNDNAPAGYVGQISSSAVSAQTVGTAGQWSDVTSIPVTAGDWDVSVNLVVERNGATFSVAPTVFAGISTTSGNSGTGIVTGDNEGESYQQAPTTFLGTSVVIPAYRMTFTGSSTVYLKGYVDGYTSGSPKHYARISARRAR